MQLSPGLVISLPDPRVRPRNKLKWQICVCPQQRRFLRINSKPLWSPWHYMAASQNRFLDHDSYVELTSLHFFTESELRGARVVGTLSPAEQVDLAFSAREADTLNDEQKDLIWERLGF
jgi:hypothetical protein